MNLTKVWWIWQRSDESDKGLMDLTEVRWIWQGSDESDKSLMSLTKVWWIWQRSDESDRSHKTDLYLIKLLESVPRGLIPRRNFVRQSLIPDEICSVGSNTPMTSGPWGLIPQVVLFHGVWYSEEFYSARYQAPLVTAAESDETF
jgi:hypothetical protein